MKRKMIILILSILILLLIPIPKYRELNHLSLIHTIEVTCTKNEYIVNIKEIIPQKEDNGITYKYKTYKVKGNTLSIIKKELAEKKTFYYQGIKKLITNCSNTNEIIDTFSLNIKKTKIERTN